MEFQNQRTTREEILLTEGQLRSLGSPVRNEIFATLLRFGPASVGEIAAAMGQPASGLYYHLRHLLRAGLVRDEGKRPAATRSESVYAVAAGSVRVDPETRAPGYLEALAKLFDSVLRRLSRRLRSALHEPEVRRSGPARQVTLRTYLVRLEEADLVELNRRFDDVGEFLASRADAERGRLQQVLLASAPLSGEAAKGGPGADGGRGGSQGAQTEKPGREVRDE
jgi:DNA-binding transcriptional ArsR family regulator